MMRSARPVLFLAPIIFVYIILATAIYIDIAVLWRAGELKSLENITDPEFRARTLYSALSISFSDYKYAAYRKPTPAIVAIGTSRAMQIRASFFRKSFYNLGGLVQGPEQANLLADRLLLQGKHPEIVIFVLDFWTFCQSPGVHAPVWQLTAMTHDGMGNPDRYFLIYRLLLDGRYSVADFARLFFPSATAEKKKRIGLSAIVGQAGFAADGSLYGEPDPKPSEKRFDGTRERVVSGVAQFVKSCVVSEVAIAALRKFVEQMDAAGIRTALLMAPLPGTTIHLMQLDGRYRYIDELRKNLKKEYPARFFDFYDMSGVSPDSEFFDGFHGGEITYMRMLVEAARPNNSPLNGLVDVEKLKNGIRRGEGLTFDPQNPIYKEFFSNK